MSRNLRRIGLGSLVLIALIALVAAIYLPRAAKSSFPLLDGTLQTPGLLAEVQIYRDDLGVAHIFGSTEHDLFFAQGFVHAQDRFWQMDFQRHASSGRLSELLGSATLDTDVFLRAMGWQRIAEEELTNLDAQALSAIEAYAAGVNAYISGKSNLELSFEYLFLSLLNPNYQPEPWRPLHTLTWAKAMAWDLGSNMDTEIQRALLLQTMSAEQVDELFPPYPSDAPIIVPDFASAAANAQLSQSEPTLDSNWTRALQIAAERFVNLDALLGSGSAPGIGSNSWAVSGDLTASGAPILANDPHLGVSLPSIWYQNSLHCLPVSIDCSLEASGVSFVGAPGVVIGHNANIAWGFTNLGPDVMDLYIIKVNPDNELQYELNGAWIDMQLVTETIQVAGKEDISLPVRITKFGPIISDSYGPLTDFAETSGMELPENFAVALRWTALEPNNTFSAILKFNFAYSWEEFQNATRDFVVPSQNLIYADTAGNIGYQMPGNVPIRANGDGRYPVPGWTDEYDWLGYIPFEELPFSLNPTSGYIVTANNAVVTDAYPHHIADTWAYGYRAQRILDLLATQPNQYSIADFQTMQADNLNPLAEELIAALDNLELNSPDGQQALDLLQTWDGQQNLDSAPAALFNVFLRNLIAQTLHDELPEDYWPDGRSRWFAILEILLADPQSAWWDNINTPSLENRDDILLTAFTASLKEMQDLQGNDPAEWRWGALHTITFEHQVMNNFPLINRLFNRGPFETQGGTNVVNATTWSADSGSYEVRAIPSKRSLMDLGNWDNSLQINSMGQSGHAYHPNYVDMTPLWVHGENHAMYWEFESIQAAAAALLILEP